MNLRPRDKMVVLRPAGCKAPFCRSLVASLSPALRALRLLVLRAPEVSGSTMAIIKKKSRTVCDFSFWHVAPIWISIIQKK